MQRFLKIGSKFYFWIISSLLLTFIIEFIGFPYSNFEKRLLSITPYMFFLNSLMVLVITVIIFFVRRWLTVYSIIATILVLLAIINRLLIVFRGSPFTYSDFSSLLGGIDIFDRYLSIGTFTFLTILIVVYICFIYLVFKIEGRNKNKIDYKKNIKYLNIVWILCLFNILFNKFDLIIERPWDIKYSYEKNGILYSFVESYFEYKRVSPEDYNRKNIIEIKNNILNDSEQIGVHFPNIIMIQLESFFDPMSIKGISYSEDPIPNFREFSNRYTSGFLSAPTYGGGTPRSEFEVLTAFNIDFLVPGEIPHQTILKSNSLYSYADKLGSLNYTSHFFHNYKGDFYGRNIVYKNLGFDTFSSIELLPAYELSLNNWPKDETLILPMLEAIKSTQGPDFIYTITMESHGAYSDENIILPIEVYGDYDNKIIYQLKNYVNILKGVDDFIGSLITSINNLNEDTVVVLFSDHLPSLEYFKTVKTDDSTLFSTPFVIIDNFSLGKNDFNCEMYQLTTKLSEILNLGYSPIESLHSVLMNDPYYLSTLEIIQYDILFGSNIFNSETESFNSRKIQYSLNQVLIKDIHITDELIVVEGENFNYSSKIFIDNKEMETRYINDKVLEIDKPKKFEVLDIRQVTSNGIVLSQTPKIHMSDL